MRSTLIDDVRWLYFSQMVLEMANMQPEDTGLLPIVHIMHRGGVKHGARVKVSNIAGRFAHDNFTVTAEKEPRVVGRCKLKKDHLQYVLDWVLLNRDHIRNVWENGDTMRAREIEDGFSKI